MLGELTLQLAPVDIIHSEEALLILINLLLLPIDCNDEEEVEEKGMY
jgi:hypothetical protein